MGGRQPRQIKNERKDSRNPDLPVSRTSGPVHTVHLGIALTVIHQAPHQYLVFIRSQETAICWPVRKPPIHDNAHANGDTPLDDEDPWRGVSSFANDPMMIRLTISIHRIL